LTHSPKASFDGDPTLEPINQKPGFKVCCFQMCQLAPRYILFARRVHHQRRFVSVHQHRDSEGVRGRGEQRSAAQFPGVRRTFVGGFYYLQYIVFSSLAETKRYSLVLFLYTFSSQGLVL
jgi:hypothetical protein